MLSKLLTVDSKVFAKTFLWFCSISYLCETESCYYNLYCCLYPRTIWRMPRLYPGYFPVECH